MHGMALTALPFLGRREEVVVVVAVFPQKSSRSYQQIGQIGSPPVRFTSFARPLVGISLGAMWIDDMLWFFFLFGWQRVMAGPVPGRHAVHR